MNSAILIDKIKRRQPLPFIVSDKIRRLIQDGVWPPGFQLPSEAELSQAMGISRATLRAALTTLEREGLIIRRHGVGTFVADRPLLRNNLHINFGITELIESMGLEPGCKGMKISLAPAESYVAEQLDLVPDSKVVTIERIRTASGKPVVFSIDIFPDVLLERPASKLTLDGLIELLKTKLSLYYVFEKHLGLLIDHGIAEIKPVKADDLLAKKLHIPKDAALLYLKQVDFDIEQRPILLSHEYHVAEVSTFTIYRKR